MFHWVLNTLLVQTIKEHILQSRLQKKWIFRKSGPYDKIYYIGQKHLHDKFKVADFKYDSNFS